MNKNLNKRTSIYNRLFFWQRLNIHTVQVYILIPAIEKARRKRQKNYSRIFNLANHETEFIPV